MAPPPPSSAGSPASSPSPCSFHVGRRALYLTLILLSSLACSIVRTRSQDTRLAYVTLLYGDQFLLGVRVLGQSLRETNTKNDLLALVSSGVSDEAERLLQADGWKIKRVDLVGNPNIKHPSSFWGVYTKLRIFNLTEYDKVVYLDADTIVLKSIEDMFECRKFCATLKHSERLNSGVLVIEPDEKVFNDMLSKIKTLPSYTGGDQGFLNSYYSDFPNAHLFEPGKSAEKKFTTMERLSTLYNADIGLFMLANKWMVEESELKILHYTLGPLKPWDWWTAWLLTPVTHWQKFRMNLPASLPGTDKGKSFNKSFYVLFLSSLPLVLFLLLNKQTLFQVFCGSKPFSTYLSFSTTSNGALPVQPNGSRDERNSNHILTLISFTGTIVCFMCLSISAAITFILLPRQVFPWTGMLLFFELFFFFFFSSFSRWLIFVRDYSFKHSLTSDNSINMRGSTNKKIAPIDSITLVFYLTILFVAISIPATPYLLNVTSLFGRLGLVSVGACVETITLTYSSHYLTHRWFLLGKQDWQHSHF